MLPDFGFNFADSYLHTISRFVDENGALYTQSVQLGVDQCPSISAIESIEVFVGVSHNLPLLNFKFMLFKDGKKLATYDMVNYINHVNTLCSESRGYIEDNLTDACLFNLDTCKIHMCSFNFRQPIFSPI